eukprot:NODE_5948_length_1718_cov_7.576367.p1 GENE.NODE_5948_length_1718_cov_7.576367~~NODE_5948_length_1718_cov_7.576367.p1  ORF type:complete len:420 (+),score=107.87 NODE_5948_length_1718_cov_7.576367:195-1454(+)
MEDELAKQPLQSNRDAVMNLVNNCLGSGILAVAYAVKDLGLLFALLVFVSSALLNRCTLLLNVTSCQIAKCDPATAALGEAAYGKSGRLLMIAMYNGLGFFCMVSYVSASTDAIGTLLEGRFNIEPLERPVLMVTIWAVLLAPLTLVRSLRSIAKMSMVALCGGMIMLITVQISCVTLLTKAGALQQSIDNVKMFPDKPADIMTGLPLLLMIFSVQAGGGVVLAAMEDVSHQNCICVSRNAYITVFFIDFFVGFVSYITFLSETQADIIENLPAKSTCTVAAEFAMLTLVVLSYVIMIIPCKVTLIDFFFGKNEALGEASAAQFYAMTLCLNLAALGVALAISDLGLILQLNGAICTNFCAFIMPSAYYMKVRANPQIEGMEPRAFFSPRNAPWLLLLIFGLVSFVVFTYQVIVALSDK